MDMSVWEVNVPTVGQTTFGDYNDGHECVGSNRPTQYQQQNVW